MPSSIIIGQGGGSGGGSGSNASVGPTGATAPTSATEIGIIVAGNLEGVSAANPLPVSGAGGGTQYTDETAETAGAFTITAVGLYNGTDVVGLRGDASNNLLIKVNTALPAGTNLIGQVEITDGTNILGTSTHPVRIDPTGTTVQPISASALPLPSNAAQETGGNLAAIKTDTDKIPSLGQALAAASVPVVLTALQVNALTPPAAITNYAEETGGNLATIAGAVSSSKIQANITNTSLSVTEVPATSGGVSANIQNALSDSVETVKSSPGQLYGYSFFNQNSGTVYLLFYNNASPTVGSTTPIYAIGMPAGAAGHISFGIGIPFSSGIYVLASTSLSSAAAPSSSILLTSLYE